VFTQVEAQWHS